MYCELCGEKFDYLLRRIPVKLSDGRIVSMLACELCDMDFNEDAGEQIIAPDKAEIPQAEDVFSPGELAAMDEWVEYNPPCR